MALFGAMEQGFRLYSEIKERMVTTTRNSVLIKTTINRINEDFLYPFNATI